MHFPPAPRGGRTRRLPVVGGTIWVATVGLVAVRELHLDDAGVLVAALAGAPWVWLPLFVAAVVAAARRRWVLVAVAVAGLVVPGWWTVGQFHPWRTANPPGGSWPRLRVFDANVTWYNDRAGAIAGAVAADHPDVVALEEVTPGLVAALRRSPAFARFRWHLLDPSPHAAGMALWSDRPLTAAAVWVDDHHPELRARVRVGPAEVQLLVVHTFIPVELPVGQWRRELAGIAGAAARLHGPRIVVGDFNATWDMWELHQVLRRGRLTDAAVDTGHGGDLTFRPFASWPTLITIDHLLVSRQLGVARFRLGPDPGAQHRSLEATVAVRPGAG